MEIKDEEAKHGLLVHHFLALSYSGYLIAIILGFILNSTYPVDYSPSFFAPLGVFLILLGTSVAFWAQYMTGNNRKARHEKAENKTLGADHFLAGPYSFVRVPTQYSIFLMTLGLAFIYNSVWMIGLTFVAFIIGRFIFIPKEEEHMAEKYGQAFLDYKKKVRF